jgi:hypothetical protein
MGTTRSVLRGLAAMAAAFALPCTASAQDLAKSLRPSGIMKFNGVPKDSVCDVVSVAAYTDRIHLQCLNTMTPGVTYLAVETTSPLATHALVVADMARLSDYSPSAVLDSTSPGMETYAYYWASVDVTYDENPDHNPGGCLSRDCRRLLAISVARRLPGSPEWRRAHGVH